MQDSNVKTVTISPNETNAYICEIKYLGKNPDMPKLAIKAGIQILEEVVLDILPAPDAAYMNINDIKALLELQGKMDDSSNWEGFIIEGILKKLEYELRAQPEVTVTEKGTERRIGWRLSRNEYEERNDIE